MKDLPDMGGPAEVPVKQVSQQLRVASVKSRRPGHRGLAYLCVCIHLPNLAVSLWAP